ncbi:MAG: hypothetical protein ACTSP3_09730 [Candidatus Heimdallarchaeaceae archaeon]
MSSKISDKIQETDILIDSKHEEFKLPGLKTSSIIKIDKVVTILKELVFGEIGEIGPKLKHEINSKMSNIFKL